MKSLKGRVIAATIATLVISWAFSGSILAIQVGKTVEYNGGGMGKVIFDGKKHNDAGYHCLKCHNGIFITKIGSSKITYFHHTEKKLCFACHNGKEAFGAGGNCYVCHKK